MRQVYTVYIDGSMRYHGINREDALETIIAANVYSCIQVQRTAWPRAPRDTKEGE